MCLLREALPLLWLCLVECGLTLPMGLNGDDMRRLERDMRLLMEVVEDRADEGEELLGVDIAVVDGEGE